MAELTSVLFFHTMRYSVKEPKGANADRFILSKGHAAPILYAGQCFMNGISTYWHLLGRALVP